MRMLRRHVLGVVPMAHPDMPLKASSLQSHPAEQCCCLHSQVEGQRPVPVLHGLPSMIK